MKYRVRVFIFMALSFLLAQSIYGMRNKEVRLYSPKSNTRMKKIFLCSSFADVAPLLPESVPTSLSGKTVAFIPTASIHEEYTQYVEDGKNVTCFTWISCKRIRNYTMRKRKKL